MKFKPTSKTIKITCERDFVKFANLGETISDEIIENGKEWVISATNNIAKVRNNAQNALAACYYQTVSDETGESSERVKTQLKLDIGLKILLVQSGEMSGEAPTKSALEAQKVMDLLKVINFKLRPYSEKMKIMRVTPCTSLFTSKNFQRFLKDVEIKYAERGIILQSVNETLRNQAMNL